MTSTAVLLAWEPSAQLPDDTHPAPSRITMQDSDWLILEDYIRRGAAQRLHSA